MTVYSWHQETSKVCRRLTQTTALKLSCFGGVANSDVQFHKVSSPAYTRLPVTAATRVSKLRCCAKQSVMPW